MVAWMLYAGVVGALMAMAGLAAERLLAGAGRPRRFTWLMALTLAVVIPLAGGLGGPGEPVPVVGGDSALTAGGSAESAKPWSIIPPLLPAADPSLARPAAMAWAVASAGYLVVLCMFLVFVARARYRWDQRRIDGSDLHVSRRFGPAVVGIIRPVIVVPSWVLEGDSAERETILRHEFEHARERDHLALLYAGLVTAVFPWSPAVWWMFFRLRAAVEMDCDRRVISSGIAAADYSRVLVDAAIRSHGRCGLAPAIGQPRSLLEWRLRTMNSETTRLSRAHGMLLATVALIAVAIACDVPTPTQLDEAIGEVVANGRGGLPKAELPTADLPTMELPTANLPTLNLPSFVLIDGERIPISEEKAAYWHNRFREAFGGFAARNYSEWIKEFRVIHVPGKGMSWEARLSETG